uniref:UDP-glycosyltransferase n=1 Tax=Timema douglasi TaxID=61478 RepID=A0A7R8VMW6_TIMDO|nr:unnamed protein product [Timema douglasi]
MREDTTEVPKPYVNNWYVIPGNHQKASSTHVKCCDISDNVSMKTESTQSCQKQFLKKFEGRHPPSIWALSKKLETKGILLDDHAGGRPQMSEETIQNGKDRLLEFPKKSLRQLLQESELPRSTCQLSANGILVRSRNAGFGSEWDVNSPDISRFHSTHIHMMIGTLCLLVMLTALTTPAYTARILGVAPFPAPSHQILLTSLFKELANRGHHLTVITPLPLKEGKPPNYVEIDTGVTFPPGIVDSNNMFKGEEVSRYMVFIMMWNIGPKLLESTFENPDVQKLLHSKTEKFDLLLTETFFNEAILGLAHKFNVPIISVCAFAGLESMGDAVGNPYPYSYVPNALTKLTTHMSFLERLQNTLLNTYVKLGHYLYYLPKQNQLLVKYFKDTKENLPYVDDLVKRTSLVFLNNHFSYNFPRPYVPNIVEVGGFHVKPAKKLPQDLQKFMDDAKEGVVYFSLGSNLQSSALPEYRKEAFLKAFSKLKQKVLWKFEADNLPGQPANVKIQKWLPQSDILGHPNIRLFITHGGLLSTQEAIYNGVPLVGIPLFADQKNNVLKSEENGLAKLMDFQNITESSLDWVLDEVLNKPTYLKNAKRISKIYLDQPKPPMDLAVYWTEYVIRHKGAPHLRSASLDLNWFQLHLLDVAAVLILILAIVIIGLVFIIRTLVRLVTTKKEPLTKSSKKKN